MSKVRKEVIAVYQDCVLCGDRGKKKHLALIKKGLDIRKVSAFSDEGESLCHKAVFSHGIKSMPFFTDGTTFSTSLKSFLPVQEPKSDTGKISDKKNRKTKKEEVESNEPNPED